AARKWRRTSASKASVSPARANATRRASDSDMSNLDDTRAPENVSPDPSLHSADRMVDLYDSRAAKGPGPVRTIVPRSPRDIRQQTLASAPHSPPSIASASGPSESARGAPRRSGAAPPLAPISGTRHRRRAPPPPPAPHRQTPPPRRTGALGRAYRRFRNARAARRLASADFRFRATLGFS